MARSGTMFTHEFTYPGSPVFYETAPTPSTTSSSTSSLEALEVSSNTPNSVGVDPKKIYQILSDSSAELEVERDEEEDGDLPDGNDDPREEPAKLAKKSPSSLTFDSESKRREFFVRSLTRHHHKLSTKVWDESATLQEYYLSQAPLSEKLSVFKSALASRCKKLIDCLFTSTVEEEFCGTMGEGTDLVLSSIIKENFLAACASRAPRIYKAMISKNRLLEKWVFGNNIETADTFHDFIELWAKLLSLQATDLVRAIWLRNQTLKNYYSGASVEYQRGEGKVTFCVSLEACNTIISSLLRYRVSAIAKEIACNNKRYPAWLTAQRVTQTLDPQREKPTQTEQPIQLLDSVAVNTNAASATMSSDASPWPANGLSFSLFSRSGPVMSTITWDDLHLLIKEFLASVNAGDHSKANSVLQLNKALFDFLNGKLVFITLPNSNHPIPKKIEMNEWLSIFVQVLYGKYEPFIKMLLTGNPLFKYKFYGWELHTSLSDGHVLIQSEDALRCIKYFHVALHAKVDFVLEAMWGMDVPGGNKRLRKIIQDCTSLFERGINMAALELLVLVLYSHLSGKSRFISSYVELITDSSLISAAIAVVQNRSKESPTADNQQRYDILAMRLNSLRESANGDREMRNGSLRSYR